MRFDFENGEYLEFQRSKKPHHVYVIVAARKQDNPLELLVNSAEISLKDFLQGAQSVTGPLILDQGKTNEANSSDNNLSDSEPTVEE